MSELPVINDAERRRRLAVRHGLSGSLASVEAATAAMTCWHATEPASVHLAVWARCGATRAEVDAALYQGRSIVKQLAMRRTVFGFPPDLLPAVWGSAAARVARQQEGHLARDVERCGIGKNGQAWVAEQTAAVRELLLSEGPHTTAQLRSVLPALNARLTYAPGKSYGGDSPIAPRVLTTLAASGTIVRGENDGGWKTSRPRWTACEDWLSPVPEPLPEADGYAALVSSWLRTFGPGTESDMVWWLGATKAAVRRALADVGAAAVALESGETAYVLPGDLGPTPQVQPWAALLPALDPTTMGWKERDFYLGPHAAALFDRNGNGGPSAWWNGRIIGGWHQDPDGTVVVVPAEPLSTAAERALAEQAAHLTAWFDGEVVKSIYQSPLVRIKTKGR